MKRRVWLVSSPQGDSLGHIETVRNRTDQGGFETAYFGFSKNLSHGDEFKRFEDALELVQGAYLKVLVGEKK